MAKKKFPDSKKARKTRIEKIIDILKKEYPEAGIQLDFGNPFELLAATVLSAQCTDARVNIVTRDLFDKYRTLDDYVNADIEEFEQDIYSTGFYKAKAKNILGAAKMIKDDFNGEVPGTMVELLALPGIGRKSANVILGHIFGVPGIVVDTHVIRLSNRLGFVKTKDALKIEMALMEIVPKDIWVMFTHYIILHGRKICSSRKAKCDECNISEFCPSVGNV